MDFRQYDNTLGRLHQEAIHSLKKGNDLIIRFAVPDKSKTGIGGTGGFSSVGGFGGMNIISSVTIDIWTIKGGALQPGGFNNNFYGGSNVWGGGFDWDMANTAVGAFGFGLGAKTGLIDFASRGGELSKETANYLKFSKGLGVIGGVATIAITGYDIYEKGSAISRNIADISFATAGVVSVFIVSNPLGWVVGGASLVWVAGTLIYDYYNDKK